MNHFAESLVDAVLDVRGVRRWRLCEVVEVTPTAVMARDMDQNKLFGWFSKHSHWLAPSVHSSSLPPFHFFCFCFLLPFFPPVLLDAFLDPSPHVSLPPRAHVDGTEHRPMTKSSENDGIPSGRLADRSTVFLVPCVPHCACLPAPVCV